MKLQDCFFCVRGQNALYNRCTVVELEAWSPCITDVVVLGAGMPSVTNVLLCYSRERMKLKYIDEFCDDPGFLNIFCSKLYQVKWRFVVILCIHLMEMGEGASKDDRVMESEVTFS